MTTPHASGRARTSWFVLMALCSGQFVMVLDTTVMNVSIQRVIVDLGTTATTMQLAIATYTLTTAALMLVGGKVGDIIGRRRALRFGLVIFGVGAAVTALAPNVGMLILGWSILEAVGAALMVPAILALIGANYDGRQRTIAYGAIGGIAGAAAAAGPLIGGWVATIGSWRDVFGAEAVLMVVLLPVSVIVKDAPLGRARPHLDAVGSGLSAAGLALAVLGIVQSSTWGWIHPKDSLTIAAHSIDPLGLSVVPFLIAAGAVLLVLFALWERHVAARGRDTLVDLGMLRLGQLRAGLGAVTMMFICLGGIFFVVPLYLEVVVGKDPLQTGVAVLPMSLAVFAVALGGSRLSGRVAPRLLIQIGFVCVGAGAMLLFTALRSTFDALPFEAAASVTGIGLGLIASQVTNVNLATAGPEKTSEIGAVQGTAQNLGSALGTAIIGSLMLGVLTTTFTHHVQNNPTLPAVVRQHVAARTEHGLAFVPPSLAAAELQKEGVPAPVVEKLERTYSQSQVDALRTAVAGLVMFALLGLFLTTRRLPARPLRAPPAPDFTGA